MYYPLPGRGLPGPGKTGPGTPTTHDRQLARPGTQRMDPLTPAGRDRPGHTCEGIPGRPGRPGWTASLQATRRRSRPDGSPAFSPYEHMTIWSYGHKVLCGGPVLWPRFGGVLGAGGCPWRRARFRRRGGVSLCDGVAHLAIGKVGAERGKAGSNQGGEEPLRFPMLRTHLERGSRCAARSAAVPEGRHQSRAWKRQSMRRERKGEKRYVRFSVPSPCPPRLCGGVSPYGVPLRVRLGGPFPLAAEPTSVTLSAGGTGSSWVCTREWAWR